jgi:hypothetical protein
MGRSQSGPRRWPRRSSTSTISRSIIERRVQVMNGRCFCGGTRCIWIDFIFGCVGLAAGFVFQPSLTGLGRCGTGTRHLRLGSRCSLRRHAGLLSFAPDGAGVLWVASVSRWLDCDAPLVRLGFNSRTLAIVPGYSPSRLALGFGAQPRAAVPQDFRENSLTQHWQRTHCSGPAAVFSAHSPGMAA